MGMLERLLSIKKLSTMVRAGIVAWRTWFKEMLHQQKLVIGNTHQEEREKRRDAVAW